MSIQPLNPRDSQPVSSVKRDRVPGVSHRAEGVEKLEHSYASQRAKALEVVKQLEVDRDRPNMAEWVRSLDEKPTMDKVMDGLANLLALGETTS